MYQCLKRTLIIQNIVLVAVMSKPRAWEVFRVEESKKRKVDHLAAPVDLEVKEDLMTPKRQKRLDLKAPPATKAQPKSILKKTKSPKVKSQSQPQAKKKEKVRKPKADRASSVKPSTAAGTDAEAPSFLLYLERYQKHREDWKFNKATQTHILKNIFHPFRIPGSYDEALSLYIAGLQGLSARSRLLEEAQKTVKALDEELLETHRSLNEMESLETHQQAVRDALQRDLEKVKNAKRLAEAELREQSADYKFKLGQRLRAETVIKALGHEIAEEAEKKPRPRRRKNRTDVPDNDSSSSSSSASSSSASSSASSSEEESSASSSDSDDEPAEAADNAEESSDSSSESEVEAIDGAPSGVSVGSGHVSDADSDSESTSSSGSSQSSSSNASSSSGNSTG